MLFFIICQVRELIENNTSDETAITDKTATNDENNTTDRNRRFSAEQFKFLDGISNESDTRSPQEQHEQEETIDLMVRNWKYLLEN